MRTPSREQILHSLYEAAELEHTLMCTYLYAAFSLKTGADGLPAAQVDVVARWRSTILQVAKEEMAHLVAVWNLTSAIGGTPHFDRDNFPLTPGNLPAPVVVQLAPFSAAVLQHFTYLERPADSNEPEGAGFEPVFVFHRGGLRDGVTPMSMDYETVGAFYARLEEDLRAFAEHHGDAAAFCGDPALQLTAEDAELVDVRPVVCVKTALAALATIVEQGEGSPGHVEGSHYNRFAAVRDELAALRAADPKFEPAFPAAHNPVLRRPPVAEGRIWIEDEQAARTVDVANSIYGLMIRLLGFSYAVPRPSSHKRDAIDLALGLMHAMTPLAERAARLPAGPSSPGCHAGMSFTALRDAAPFTPGPSVARYVVERLDELADYMLVLSEDERTARTRRMLVDLGARAKRGFSEAKPAAPVAPARVVKLPLAPPPVPTTRDGVDSIEGEHLTLIYEGKKCIHSRFCVTGAPQVFLANVVGPWIHPDAIDVATLVEIAHECPSGAIRYRRKDGVPDETAPPVNLISIRENGPYAVRADIKLDGDTDAQRFRATLCRCGASKAKPFCDGSHHEIEFTATGEPATTKDTDMLAVRDGELAIEPLTDGPLRVRGNLEITSGTGRVVSRIQQTKLCRCGASNTKPFCDGTHQRIGFRSDR